MTPKARRAVKGSIRKWKKIAEGTGVDEGIDNCPLCKIYFDRECKGCPVRTRSGLADCRGTPYFKWRKSCNHDAFPLYADTPARKRAAWRELDFLRSLLPDKRRA